jgi:hypothetical protein
VERLSYGTAIFLEQILAEWQTAIPPPARLVRFAPVAADARCFEWLRDYKNFVRRNDNESGQ